MKTVEIEWRHYDRDGATCSRCGGTGRNLREVVEELRNELADIGAAVRLRETLLSESAMAESNLLLFDGVPLEDVVDGAAAGISECLSCSYLTGSDTECRTVVVGGAAYEEIPKDLIREALRRAALT